MKFSEKLTKQEDLLWNTINSDRAIIFWGCGNSMRIVKETLAEKGIVPTSFCDNNEKLIGTYIDNIPVLSYEQIKKYYTDYVIILTVAINNAIPIVEQLREQQEKHPIYHMEHPFKVENTFLEYQYLENHNDEFEAVYKALEDEESRNIFVQSINFKLSGNKLPLLNYVDGEGFFDEKLIPLSKHYSYMDVGAYTGDTLLRFYAFCGGKYDKLYAVEPDTGNFNALQNLVKYGRISNVQLFHVGGWNLKGELTFYTIANRNRKHFENSNFFKKMQDIVANSWEMSQKDFGTETISVDTVDNLLQGAKCDIIKINALGADYQVLMGCRETIKQYKPIIVGEFGTQSEYLVEQLNEMLRVNPNYKLYLRQKMIFGDCKTVYFAIDLQR